jgi:hypothetical protein
MKLLLRDRKGETEVDPAEVSPQAAVITELIEQFHIAAEAMKKINQTVATLTVSSNAMEEGFICETTTRKEDCVTGQQDCAVQYSISSFVVQKMLETGGNIMVQSLLDECGITFKPDWLQ